MRIIQINKKSARAIALFSENLNYYWLSILVSHEQVNDAQSMVQSIIWIYLGMVLHKYKRAASKS
ncbi:hypothetical protein BK702_15305 [Bacillus thuringiensis serovar cameroun]|nr:hypothetical protein BK702_15305 [Bacillus thuringiensis serovar cameroun]